MAPVDCLAGSTVSCRIDCIVHPALSVIIFTTLCGAGYGLLALLGLYGAFGQLPLDPAFGAAAMLLALGAVSAGLVSSTFHLGHPERAWRAFSQWRSSWLSREGVASVATYVPSVAFAIGWVAFRATTGPWAVSGILSCVCAVGTVICTAYIYRSLKPIPAWSNGWVVPNYLVLSAMTGALWLAALSAVFGYRLNGAGTLVIVTIVLAFLLKLAYWRFIDAHPGASTAESATGLGIFGKVRLLEAPHTSENYLLKEMGFRIARRHAKKLRILTVGLGFLLPLVLAVAAAAASGVVVPVCWLLAAAVAMAGVLIERWLFFAEAKHSVLFYYGRETGGA
jgi:sulfite dehydrogenase (quinone) subunit SoeC